MCRKLTFLILFVLSVLALSDALQPADASFVLWYKLDESGSAMNVPDSSGYNYNGTITMYPEELTVTWEPDGGRYGGCLVFFDDTRIDVPKSTLNTVSDGITVSLWLKDAWRVGQNWTFDAACGWEEPFRITAAVGTAPDTEVLWQAGNDSNDALRWDGGNVEELEGWHLWTFVKDEAADNMRIYFDGLPAASKGAVDDTLSTVLPTELAKSGFVFHIGASSSHLNHLKAKVDDFRLYDEALSDGEVLRLYYTGGDVEVAWRPDPADGTQNLCPDVVLSWTPGDSATQHDVYFGTDFDDVNDATTSSVAYRGGQGPNTYDAGEEELLLPGNTYYWRVDEVGGGVHKGQTWQLAINDGNAFDPVPADGETAVLNESLLSWSPGCFAASHDVYFGTDYDQVKNATTVASEYKANNPLGETSYDPCDFDYLTDYYWRIDEVNGLTKWKGQVWSFTSQTLIIDPNNTLWYKLDETEGYIAYDSSNFQNDGFVDMPLGGPPAWDPAGKWEGSLDISDDTAIWVPTATLSRVTDGVGIIFWTKDPSSPIFDANGGDSQLMVNFDSSGVIWRAGNDSNDVLTWDYGSTPIGGWTHWAFVKDEIAGTISIYCNGLLAESNSVVDSTLVGVRNKPFKIGAQTHIDGDFSGTIDDFIVYDRVLTGNEIARQYTSGGPVGKLELAWGANPGHGQLDVYRDANLAWMPGDYTVHHDVYLGTNFDDVNDATTATTGVYRGEKALGVENYTPSPLLELETTYYWRIDEVNDPNIWKGNIWRFTVANFLVIEDYESYDSDDDMYLNWEDGWNNDTGSSLLLGASPVDPVHTGDKSMLYSYNNMGPPYYSEAERALGTGERDWTDAGVKSLSLFFYGKSINSTGVNDTLNVSITGGGNTRTVSYGDHAGESMDDIKVEEWTEWRTPLSEFAPVTLSAVTELYIDFGQSGGSSAGGTGMVFFDDIRLYLPRCLPELLKPECDLNNDCIVDFGDIREMAQQWLRGDLDVTPVQDPGSGNLVGHWELEGDGWDSSGNLYDGIAEGAYEWITGRIGSQAIELSGGRVLVPDGGSTPKLRPADKISAAAWVNYSATANYSARVVAKGLDAGDRENFVIELSSSDEVGFFVRDASHVLYSVNSTAKLYHDEWIHLAGTYDANQVKCYINGQLAGSSTVGAITILQDSNSLAIGDSVDVDRAFYGKVDDVRVYDRDLTRAEVAYLASESDGTVELTSPVNIYFGESPEYINFRDAAMLIDEWRDKKFWPAD